MANSPLDKVTEFGPDGSTASIYDDWAGSYDADLLDDYGYNAPATAVAALVELAPDPQAAVVDFGCGTGLVAAELRAAGWVGPIDGLDISAGMLDVARAKRQYRDLFEADLTQPTPLADDAYGAMCCVGSMGNGHLGPEHLHEMVRTVEPGGPIVVYLNAKPWIEEDYEPAFRAVENWTIVDIVETNYMDALERPGRLVTARRV